MKQAIIIRIDIDMGKGKMCAQASHASLEAYRTALSKDKGAVSKWEFEGQKKIVLKANLETVMQKYELAKRNKLPCALIKDAGHTQIDPGTITALAIGPCEDEKLDSIVGELKLL